MHGIVLGKFMPPHQGHLNLVEFARRFADELTVVVGSLACEPIPGELRYQWMCELFPGARVVHLTDENPQLPHQHPDFWQIWRNSLQRVVDRPIDLVFASEDYGIRLAEELGATFVPCNGERSLIPISATQIRSDPHRHWSLLPSCVRAYYCRRISIFGAESTGKSTLTQQLASHFRSLWVPEFARTWLEPRQGRVELKDMPIISRGQAASEQALARLSNGWLFCDTDPLATELWSQELFGQIPRLEGQGGPYELTLVCDVDVPWVPDCVRYRPDNRKAFHLRCLELLQRANRPYAVLQGSWEERWHGALRALEALEADRGQSSPGSEE